MKITSLFFDEIEDYKVRCNLCGHRCIIDVGKSGFCRARKNIDGELYAMNYGRITSMAVDPIEKKPIFNFYPASQVLSFGSWGCNMKCPFCQNFEISQETYDSGKIAKANTIPMLYENSDADGVAFTYSEPTVWFEFVLDSCREIKTKDENIYTVFVTNGYIAPEPAKLLFSYYINATNIDLKVFNDEKYRNVLCGELSYVQKTIELALEMNVHVELTTLIVPKLNDDLKELEAEYKWISSLSKDIPLHLTRYYPRYKYDEPPTSVNFLVEAYKLAKNYLNFVYMGNVGLEEYESTYCPECGEKVIERQGYNIKIMNLDKNGGCNRCGRKIAVL